MKNADIDIGDIILLHPHKAVVVVTEFQTNYAGDEFIGYYHLEDGPEEDNWCLGPTSDVVGNVTQELYTIFDELSEL